MSTYTTNYNLEKPDSTDDFKDFRSNYNSNMDIIDANLGGGGGGNVDDVLVNGVSVVDGNHDAQITSYKEVTQAEYDALPATKLTDGIAYFIKDAGGGGGGSSSHNYSTTEQVIGTWIDGKPLYEITLNPTVNRGSNTLNHGIANFKECIRIYGKCKYNNGSDVLPLPYVSINNNYVIALGNVSATDYLIETGNGFSSIQDCYVTIQYTKTSD